MVVGTAGDSFAPYLCEFLGTFFLVGTVTFWVLAGTDDTAIWAPTSIACVLMIAIYAFGSVSGGHLNPAVSLAFGLSGKEEWSKILIYIEVQVFGGFLACLGVSQLLGGTVDFKPKGDFGWEVMVVEAFYTAMLCFVVLNVAASKRNNPAGNSNQFFALAIGFVIIAGGYAAGHISGACFNPAVSLALDFSDVSNGALWGIAYTSYQVLGAVIGAVLFRIVRPDEFMSATESQAASVLYTPSLPTKLACEFLGTYVLVFTVGLNLLSKSGATAWSAAAALMCMIYAVGDVSGAHFNPAVTLAVVIAGRGKCSASEGIVYTLFQLAGGIAGAWMFVGIAGGRTAPLQPSAPYAIGSACMAEFIFAFLLATVVLGTATVKGITSQLQRNYYFGLAIGSCVTAGGFAIGGVSGGVLNPAVSFGLATSHLLNGGDLYNCVLFSASQLSGGALAAMTFMVTHAKEYSKESYAS